MESWTIGQESPEEVLSALEYHTQKWGAQALICVDYFDTLVRRRIPPEHTKVMASQLLATLMPGFLTGSQLYARRRDVELELTTANGSLHGELDFRLDHFAARFWQLLKQEAEGQHLDAAWFRDEESFVQTLLAIELAVERAVQWVCPEMVTLLRLLHNKNIPLVLLSDFYLPQPFFQGMLDQLGLSELFTSIYVSATAGKGKGSGRLYQQVIADYGVAPAALLMIGDNPHADVAMAQAQGVQTLQVMPQPVPQEAVAVLTGREVIAAWQAIPLPAVPFAEMGASLWFFTHTLFTVLWRQGERAVFFLSKEGEFLRRLFVLYQQALYGRELINSHYLLASRKATFLASLRPLAQEDFARLFIHYRELSIRDFLRSLNFPVTDIATICQQLERDCETRLPDFPNHPTFKALRAEPFFQEVYEQRRTSQAEGFKAYLASFGFQADKGLRLVDVGWKGSIQDNIFHILGGQVEIQGYYIGSRLKTETHPRNQKKGLLFDDVPDCSSFYHIYDNNRSLFEMILGASHGSADGYLFAQTPPADASSSVHTTMQAGGRQLLILTHELPEERELFQTTIHPLQQAILQYCTQCTELMLRLGGQSPPEHWFANQHSRMVFFPREEEILFFEKLYHLENFGLFEFTRFQHRTFPALRARVGHLVNVLKDLSVLETGLWPPLILRHLGLNRCRTLDGYRRYWRYYWQERLFARLSRLRRKS